MRKEGAGSRRAELFSMFKKVFKLEAGYLHGNPVLLQKIPVGSRGIVGRNSLAPGSGLAGASAFEFKQRVDRFIPMNSLDGFAQQTRHGEGGDVYPVNGRALDGIGGDQFVNYRFTQSFDAHIAQNGVRDASQNLPRTLFLQQSGGGGQCSSGLG